MSSAFHNIICSYFKLNHTCYQHKKPPVQPQKRITLWIMWITSLFFAWITCKYFLGTYVNTFRSGIQFIKNKHCVERVFSPPVCKAGRTLVSIFFPKHVISAENSEYSFIKAATKHMKGERHGIVME